MWFMEPHEKFQQFQITLVVNASFARFTAPVVPSAGSRLQLSRIYSKVNNFITAVESFLVFALFEP